MICLGSVVGLQRYRTEWHCCSKAKQLRRAPSDSSEEKEKPARPARPARRRDSGDSEDSEDLESEDSFEDSRAGAPVARGTRAEESEESGDELSLQDLQTAAVGSKKSAEVPRIEARTSGNFGRSANSQRSSQRSNHSSDMSNGSEAPSRFETENVLGLAFLLQTESNRSNRLNQLGPRSLVTCEPARLHPKVSSKSPARLIKIHLLGVQI